MIRIEDLFGMFKLWSDEYHTVLEDGEWFEIVFTPSGSCRVQKMKLNGQYETFKTDVSGRYEGMYRMLEAELHDE